MKYEPSKIWSLTCTKGRVPSKSTTRRNTLLCSKLEDSGFLKSNKSKVSLAGDSMLGQAQL